MAVAAAKPRTSMTKRERRNLMLGLLFVSPWILGFLLFAVYPLDRGGLLQHDQLRLHPRSEVYWSGELVQRCLRTTLISGRHL